MKYIIETSWTGASRYEIEANSKKEAEQKYWDSDYKMCEDILDLMDANEEIVSVETTAQFNKRQAGR